MVKYRGEGDTSTVDEDDEEDYCDDLPDVLEDLPPAIRRGPRRCVRAEEAELAVEELPIYGKSATDKAALASALSTSFVFEVFESNAAPAAEGSVASLRDQLVAALKPVEVACGSWVMREGDTGDGMYILQRGQVELLRGSEQLKVLSPGDLFGELALLHPCSRTFSALALTPGTLLYFLHKNSYQTLLSMKQSEALPVSRRV